MGIFREIASAVTGVPISSKRSTSNSSSNPSAPQDQSNSDDDDIPGTRILRQVKRATKRIGDKGNGRE